MGRARTTHKRAARTTPATTTSSPSISSLLSKAQGLIIQCDYSLARKFTERVLAREDATPGEKSQAKEMLAITLLEIGEAEDAKRIFLSLVPPHPDAPSPPPPSAYLYLAQLMDDPHTALSHYQSAIDLLQTQLKGKSISTGNAPKEDDTETKGNIIRAYLGMVEIWMDPEYDLCVDPTASSTCDSLLSHALQVDPQNLEALHTLASVRLSQEKPEEALLALRTFPPLSVRDATESTVDPQSHTLLLVNGLPIQTRIARAKLLLECGAYPDALTLLEGVLATDDENVEGWYLMGWAWWLLAEGSKDGDVSAIAEVGKGQQLEWQDMARDARDCLETCQMFHTSQGHLDIPLLEHVKELIGTLDALGIQPSPTEEDGSDEGWEEVSDDDEDEDIEMA